MHKDKKNADSSGVSIFQYLFHNKILFFLFSLVLLAFIAILVLLLWVVFPPESNEAPSQPVEVEATNKPQQDSLTFAYQPAYFRSEPQAFTLEGTQLTFFPQGLDKPAETMHLSFAFYNLSDRQTTPTYGWADEDTIYYTSDSHLILFDTKTQEISNPISLGLEKYNFEVKFLSLFYLGGYWGGTLVAPAGADFTMQQSGIPDTAQEQSSGSTIQAGQAKKLYSFLCSRDGTVLFEAQTPSALFLVGSRIFLADGVRYQEDGQSQLVPVGGEGKLSVWDVQSKKFAEAFSLEKAIRRSTATECQVIAIGGNDKNLFLLSSETTAGKTAFCYQSFHFETSQFTVYPFAYTPFSYAQTFSAQVAWNGDVSIYAATPLLPEKTSLFFYSMETQEIRSVYPQPDLNEKKPSVFLYATDSKMLFCDVLGKISVQNYSLGGLPQWQSRLAQNYMTAMPFPRGGKKVDVTFTSDQNAKFYTKNDFESTGLYFENSERTETVFEADNMSVLFNPVCNAQGNRVAVFSAVAAAESGYIGKLYILEKKPDSQQWDLMQSYPEKEGEYTRLNNKALQNNEYFWDPTGNFLSVNFSDHDTVIYHVKQDCFYNLHNKTEYFSQTGSLLLPLEGTFSDDGSRYIYLSEENGRILCKTVSTRALSAGAKTICSIEKMAIATKYTSRYSLALIDQNTVVVCPQAYSGQTMVYASINLKENSVKYIDTPFYGGVVTNDRKTVLFAVAQSAEADSSIQPTVASTDTGRFAVTYLYDRETGKHSEIKTSGKEFSFSTSNKGIFLKSFLRTDRYEIYSFEGEKIAEANISQYFGRVPVALTEKQIFANLPESSATWFIP